MRSETLFIFFIFFHRVEAMQTPFVVGPGGVQTLTLTLDQDMAPFFVNFVLLKPATADEGDFWIR